MVNILTGEYKMAFDFINNTCQGLTEDGQALLTSLKRCAPTSMNWIQLWVVRYQLVHWISLNLRGMQQNWEMQPNWRIYWKSNNTSISSNTINNNVVAAADASGNDDVEDVNQVAAAQKKGH